MEIDGEVKEGEGNHYTTHFHQYDPRLGRWWSTDPVVQLGESPYAAMLNNPVGYSDPFGNDPPGGGGDNPLDPGKGAKTFLEGASQLVGSGRGTSGGGWEAAKSLLNRQEAMKAHVPPRPRGRVISAVCRHGTCITVATEGLEYDVSGGFHFYDDLPGIQLTKRGTGRGVEGSGSVEGSRSGLNVQVIPNPSSGRVRIVWGGGQGERGEEAKLTVYDVS